jgi:hypothetical protein
MGPRRSGVFGVGRVALKFDGRSDDSGGCEEQATRLPYFSSPPSRSLSSRVSCFSRFRWVGVRSMNGEVRKVETDGESRLVRPITIGWDRSPTIHNQLKRPGWGGIRRIPLPGVG